MAESTPVCPGRTPLSPRATNTNNGAGTPATPPSIHGRYTGSPSRRFHEEDWGGGGEADEDEAQLFRAEESDEQGDQEQRTNFSDEGQHRQRLRGRAGIQGADAERCRRALHRGEVVCGSVCGDAGCYWLHGALRHG